MTLTDEAEYLAAVEAARAAAAAYYDTDVQTMPDAQYDELIEQITAAELAHPEWTPHPASPLHQGLARVAYRSHRMSVSRTDDQNGIPGALAALNHGQLRSRAPYPHSSSSSAKRSADRSTSS